jgi:hypothetical protein
MDPLQLIAAFDAALTAAEHLGKMVAKAKAEGLITVEEQAAQKARIDALREELAD